MTKNPTSRHGLFPSTLKQNIEKVTKPALKTYGLAGSRIVSDWEKIVGHGIAQHATPSGVRFPQGKKIDGTLTIQTSGAYALELQHLQPYILEKLASYFGYRAISRIHLTQTGAMRPHVAITPPPLPPQALDAARKTALHDEIAAMEDGELKDALMGLEKAVFQ